MIFNLLKIILNETYPIKYHLKKDKKQTISKIIGFGGLLVVIMLVYGIMDYISLYISIDKNNESVILYNSYITASLLIIVFGSLHTIYSLNYTDDFKMFMIMPIKSYKLIICKMISIMIMESFLAIPIILVPTIVYGTFAGFTLKYLLCSLLVIVLLIAIPISVITLLILLSMMVVNWKKLKDSISIVFYCIVMYLAVKFFFNVDSISMDSLNNRIIGKGNAVYTFYNNITNFVISNKFDKPAITYIISGLLMVILSILFIILFNKKIDNLIIKMLNTNKSAISKGKNKFKIASKSLRKSLVSKELKVLFRTPIFLFNGLSILIMMVFIIISVKQRGINVNSIFEQYLSTNKFMVVTGLIAILAAISCINVVNTTTYSRDKYLLNFMKYQPVSEKEILITKTISVTLFSSLQILVLIILCNLIFKGHFIMWLFLGVAAIFISYLVNYDFVLSDYRNPKLNWKEPYELMKVNGNMIISMIKGLMLLLLSCMLITYVQSKLGTILGILSFLIICIIKIYINRNNSVNYIKEKETGIPYINTTENIIFYLLVYFVVQIVTSLISMLILCKAFSELSYDKIINMYLNKTLFILLISQVITIIFIKLKLYLQNSNLKKLCAIKFIGIFNVIKNVFFGMSMYIVIEIIISLFHFNNVSVSYSNMMDSLMVNSGVIMNVFVIGITAPIIEEIIFRGAILKELKAKINNKYAPIIIQAVLFGIYHLNLRQAIYGTICGIFLGIIANKEDNLINTIIMHCSFNIIGVILSYSNKTANRSLLVMYIIVTLIFIIKKVVEKVGEKSERCNN